MRSFSIPNSRPSSCAATSKNSTSALTPTAKVCLTYAIALAPKENHSCARRSPRDRVVPAQAVSGTARNGSHHSRTRQRHCPLGWSRRERNLQRAEGDGRPFARKQARRLPAGLRGRRRPPDGSKLRPIWDKVSLPGEAVRSISPRIVARRFARVISLSSPAVCTRLTAAFASTSKSPPATREKPRPKAD